MKIVNHTPFDTARLREISQRVAEAELDSNQRNGITVHFTVAKSRTKDAYRTRRLGFYVRQVGPPIPGLKFNQAIVTIRKSAAIRTPARHAAYVAHDLAHEFAEMGGYQHQHMKSARYSYRQGWEDLYQWAFDLPLTLQAKPSRPSRAEVTAKKLANAKERLATARTREKRATTIRKKWAQRVKYYEGKLRLCLEPIRPNPSRLVAPDISQEQANGRDVQKETATGEQERDTATPAEGRAFRLSGSPVDIQPVSREGEAQGPGLCA